MWVIFTQHVSHYTCRLLVRFIMGDTCFIHGVKNSSVHRLQTVPCIRQGSSYNYAHGIIDVGVLHLVFYKDRNYLLTGLCGLDTQRIFVHSIIFFIVICHLPHLRYPG